MLRALLLVPAVKTAPETGGEHYNRELAVKLRRTFQVDSVGFDGLKGFARDSHTYRAAVEKFWTENGPYDLVVQDDYVYPFAADANRWLSERCPLIGFGQAVYSERYKRPWSRWSHDRAIRRARAPYNGLIVVSETMRRHAIGLGMPAGSVVVVQPGYALMASDPIPVAKTDRLQIVTAGSYQPAKGQRTVVEAIRLLDPTERASVRVAMFGNQGFAPKYVEDLRRLVVESELTDVVTLNGPIPQKELWAEFAKADIFAFLASGEGVGMVTIEAMAHGCVPILTDDELAGELLGKPPIGFAIKPNPRDLATVLTNLVHDRERLIELSIRVQARGCSLARSWDQCVQEFADAVLRLSGQR